MTPKPPPGNFVVLYFAAAASFTGRQYDFLPAPLPTTNIFDALEEKYPGMRNEVLSSCALTVNLEYVDLKEEDQKIPNGDQGRVVLEYDEVGIIPPVSSG